MMASEAAALAVSVFEAINFELMLACICTVVYLFFVLFMCQNAEEPAAGLFEGDLFADEPLPQSSMPMNENDSDDDMGAGWDDMGAHSTASR